MPGDEHFPIESGGGSRPRRDDRPRQSSSRGRVPPHNIEAEESVLGALLLSREAIGTVSEMGLAPGDFYKPAHRHIFDAIRSLYSSGAPADTVTVADELITRRTPWRIASCDFSDGSSLWSQAGTGVLRCHPSLKQRSPGQA